MYHCFLVYFQVPDYSTVRLMKGKKRRMERHDNIPRGRNGLMNWVKKQYGAMTSFTELERGNRIELQVGVGMYLK